MSAPTPRVRKLAAPQPRKSVKASISVDVALHARWSAAASLAGMDRSAYAVEALKEKLAGLVLVDRRSRGAGQVGLVDPSSEEESAA